MPESRPGSVLDVMLDLAPPSVSRVLQPAALFASEHLGHPSDSLMPAIHDRFSTRSATDTHGPAVEALAVACLLAYLNDARPEQSIRSAVAYGAWAHAAGAAAGALAGASSGASAIPEEWIRKVLSANPDVDIPVASLMLCRSISLECGRQKGRLAEVDSMLSRPARA